MMNLLASVSTGFTAYGDWTTNWHVPWRDRSLLPDFKRKAQSLLRPGETLGYVAVEDERKSMQYGPDFSIRVRYLPPNPME